MGPPGKWRDQMTSTIKSRLRQAVLPAVAGVLALGAAGAALADNHGGDAATVTAFAGSDASIAEAIRAAEAAGQGQVVGVEFALVDGKPAWEATTQTGQAETDHVIDLASGAILSSAPDAEGPEAGEDEAREEAQLAAAKVSLGDAVAIIEAQGGRVMAAEYGTEDGTLIVEVESLGADGTVTEMLVDAQSGQAMPGDDGADDGESADDGDGDGESDDDGESGDDGEEEDE